MLNTKENFGSKVKTVGLVACVLYVFLFALRVYQTFSLTQQGSGFFTEHNITTVIMYILAVAAPVVTCVLCYVHSKSFPSGIPQKQSFVYIAGCFFFAFTLIYDAWADIGVIKEAGGFAFAKEALGGGIKVFAPLLALLSAVIVPVCCVFATNNEKLRKSLAIPMLIPVCWSILRLTDLFSVTISFLKVAQLFLSIFAMLFGMLFLFENARYMTGVGKEKSVWFFYVSGITSAGLGLCAGIPSFVCALFSPELAVSSCPFEPFYLGLAVFSLVSVIAAAKTKNVNAAPDSDTQEVTEIL